MFKIQMSFDGRLLDMPNDSGLRLSEACYRADIYKNRNPKRTFTVRNEDNDDIEYQI
jgi:hypothetical protein